MSAERPATAPGGAPPGPPRFIADCMLGKLARWLRIVGYDAAYENRISDEDLIARARREGRVLLTRDTRLVKRRALPPNILIGSEVAEIQLRQVLEELDLRVRTDGLLSRCIVCNREAVPISRREAHGEVPPYVHRTQRRFSRCPDCRRIYWRATHVEDMLERLGLDVAAMNGNEPDPSGERE